MERRNPRRNLASRMRHMARRETQRLEGVWEQYADGLSVTTSQTHIVLGNMNLPSIAPVKPVTLYGVNLAVLIARDAGANSASVKVPTAGVVAVTKVNAAEVIQNGNWVTNPSAGVIAPPWAPQDELANTRPWRAWIPFQLVGGQDSPWSVLPTRLPLRGRFHLDIGQQLAIIMATPPTGSSNLQGTIIRLTAFGRYRVIHEQLA